MIPNNAISTAIVQRGYLNTFQDIMTHTVISVKILDIQKNNRMRR